MRARVRLLTATSLAAALTFGLGIAALAAGGSGSVKAAADAPSAMTKQGDTAFSDLEVTVSKTRQLRNEVVLIDWKGGARTEPTGASGFRRNFLQIMQCWGDDAAGPTPDQCVFGAIDPVQPDAEIGRAVRNRQVRGELLPTDPAETHTVDPNDPSKAAFVPFDPVDGEPVRGTISGFSVYFDSSTTNELPTARTHADGSGEEIFDVQTAAEAPGLGCGKTITKAGGAKGPRSCWLVVVPRSDREVDGSVRSEDGDGEQGKRLQTSPFSASNWAHRITFPLDFRAIPEPCALTGDPTIVLGQENITEAFTNWQPLLCTTTKSVFDYNEVPDSVGRGKLSGENPSLSIVGAPPSADSLPKGTVIAPIAISGLVIAYNWEIQANDADPPAAQARDGARMPNGIKLTPRLVVKLLTQSYRSGSPNPLRQPANPRRLEDDPEFLAVNPDMAELQRRASTSIVTILTPLNPTDVNRQLWAWIAADAEAKSFIAGQDDGHGMKINPDYQGMDPTREDYPKLDSTCTAGPALEPPPPDLCTLDLFPYSGSLGDGARSALKGDTQVRANWSPTSSPPSYGKNSPQQRGKRAMMALTDTANAARYDLHVAALRNANGKFVTPTAASLLATVNAWKKSAVPGALTPDPNVKGDAVYPLTNISYAAVLPAGSSQADAAQNAAARKAYAGFIDYAIGAGQKPGEALGQLPAGYAPLPSALVKTGAAAVKALKTYKPPAAAKPNATPKPTGSKGGGSPGGTENGSDGAATPAPTPADTPVASPGPAELPGVVPTPTPAEQSSVATTAITPVSGVSRTGRYSLVWVLIAGLAAGLAARALPRALTAGVRAAGGDAGT